MTQKRDDDKAFVFGIRAVTEAIDSGKEINKIYLSARGNENPLINELLAKARENHISVQRVPVEKIQRMVRGNHQGIVASVSPVAYANLENIIIEAFENGIDPVVVILDGLTDVRNFGAIARTAEASGISALVIPEDDSVQITPDAVKTSAGALMHVPVCRVKNLKWVMKFLHDSGFRIFAATEKAVKNYTQADFSGPSALIMGSEDKGISLSLLKESDEWISLPMTGKIKSLNVAVSAGIFFYEILRQRNPNE